MVLNQAAPLDSVLAGSLRRLLASGHVAIRLDQTKLWILGEISQEVGKKTQRNKKEMQAGKAVEQ